MVGPVWTEDKTGTGTDRRDTDPMVIKCPARANTQGEEGQMLLQARAGAGESFAFRSMFFGKVFPCSSFGNLALHFDPLFAWGGGIWAGLSPGSFSKPQDAASLGSREEASTVFRT